MSLAERRPRRLNRRLPKRYRDIIPQPLPLLPPLSVAPVAGPSTLLPPAANIPMATPLESSSVGSRIHRLFRTPRNIFGLFRQYYSHRLPSHDPEEYVDLQGLSDIPITATEWPSLQPQNNPPSEFTNGSTRNPFDPYPNKNSFLLGEWYWNHGVQKSTESLKSLLRIVGDAEFRPEDVRDTKWGKISASLAKNDFDGGIEDDGSGYEWLDEDAGWNRTPINISVPFHSRAEKPGPKNYVVGDLYHRSLVSVIREKLAHPQDDQQFHYEPFELFWRPPGSSADVRVYNELYTSAAFLDAHRELQDSPGESGCDLPKVVVAMMFWSDATHLTSFGNAKLWPSYLFFGNESKYRRCKPTCHLCNHVAYFQTVSFSCVLPICLHTHSSAASRRVQGLRNGEYGNQRGKQRPYDSLPTRGVAGSVENTS
jgi:hypothetical protein